MDPSDAGLEPDPDVMRALIELAGERIVEHLTTLDTQRASAASGAEEAARLVREPLPEHGQPYAELLDLVFGRLLDTGFHTAHPGALSYVTGGGLFHSAVADLIAAATNRYVAYWGASPGIAELERVVVRWCADVVGLPSSAGGVLLSGGSMANLSALVTARRTLLGDDFSRGVVYASDQVHHSVEKAVMLAGFPDGALRVVPSDPALRIRVDELESLIRQDRAAGRTPFCVVGSAGTTNTGAVDDLVALADLAERESLWLHVDAAYGGFFALTERGRAELAGLGRADSITLDPHKSLFLPFGTGCLLAKDLSTLRRAHQLHSDYIHAATEIGDDAGAVNFGDLSAEMSRGVRGLRIWLPMKLLGAATFRRALDEKLDLALYAADAIARTPGFELVARPKLSILAFRPSRPDLAPAELDALTRRVLDRVNQRGRAHLSATRSRGAFHAENLRAFIPDAHPPYRRLPGGPPRCACGGVLTAGSTDGKNPKATWNGYLRSARRCFRSWRAALPGSASSTRA